jgi:hypothetical protein
VAGDTVAAEELSRLIQMRNLAKVEDEITAMIVWRYFPLAMQAIRSQPVDQHGLPLCW